jgi:hypothetical protein
MEGLIVGNTNSNYGGIGGDVAVDGSGSSSDSDRFVGSVFFGRNSLLRRISLLDADDLESIFSDIRSENESSRQGITNEVEEYGTCTPFQRAFPERSFALIVTLIFELPTLFLISGGSDRLCYLIGRKKYTTLISLLPLISAISGNVGLQASTLTTRAISHMQVRVDNYLAWLCKEIVAAVYLGEYDHINWHVTASEKLISFFLFVLVINEIKASQSERSWLQ